MFITIDRILPRKILSAVLVVLMLTSVTISTVGAGEVFPVIPAATFAVPELTEMVIGGITVIMTGVAALHIATYLDHRAWEHTQEGWDKLMKDCGNELTKKFPIHSARDLPKWRDAVNDDEQSPNARRTAQAGRRRMTNGISQHA